MPSFNPKAEEHQGSKFIKDPGRYVFMITKYERKQTKKGDEAIVAECEVLLGECREQTIRRMFLMEGKGTRWFADLLNALDVVELRDYMDDVELSLALGRRAFAAQVERGDPHPTKKDREGKPLRYMEIQEVFPINQQEVRDLQRQNFLPGIQAGTTINGELESRKKRNSEPPDDDTPHPADRDDEGGGMRQAGDYVPSDPGDDDIPF
jgi:hypothetical protein